jgi:hypothetical protein
VSSTYSYCIHSLLIDILALDARIKENLKRWNAQKTGEIEIEIEIELHWKEIKMLMRGLGPIFQRVGASLISGDLTLIRLPIQRIQLMQPLHHFSVGYQPSTTQLISPR